MTWSARGHSLAAKRPGRWLTWGLGIAIVAGVSFAALHFSEAEQIAAIAERARPAWLLVAILLQLATYVAQGETWRVIAKAARFPLSAGTVFRLSLAKLFIDQALPSAGVSGNFWLPMVPGVYLARRMFSQGKRTDQTLMRID